eukprot:4362674-Amphidinium_carterae.2
MEKNLNPGARAGAAKCGAPPPASHESKMANSWLNMRWCNKQQLMTQLERQTQPVAKSLRLESPWGITNGPPSPSREVRRSPIHEK